MKMNDRPEQPRGWWRRLRMAAVAAGAMATAGCPPTTPPPSPQADSAGGALKEHHALMTNNPLHPAPPPPSDAPEAVRVMIHLEVYELIVPYGTVSGNEDFWKRIDEQTVDVATFDRLWRNGVRVGEAPAGEWPYFKQIIDQQPARAHKQLYIGLARETREIEITAAADVRFQNLFIFDDSNRMIGRSFERSMNLWMLSFEPTPRRPGSVRVALCPVVRSRKQHLEFVGDREGRTIEYVSPERLYDLNLVVDIPLERFLVVAPSPEAIQSTSIGHNFLGVDGTAERMERVLLFVPIPYVLDPSEAAAPEG